MVQRPFSWLRPFRSSKPPASPAKSTPMLSPTPPIAPFSPADDSLSRTARTSSSASSTIPYHSAPPPAPPTSALPPRRNSRRARRAAAAAESARLRERRARDAFARAASHLTHPSPVSEPSAPPTPPPPARPVPLRPEHARAQAQLQPITIDFAALQAADARLQIGDAGSDDAPPSARSIGHGSVHSAHTSTLDSFVPYRPSDGAHATPIALSGLAAAFEEVPVQPRYGGPPPGEQVEERAARKGRYVMGGGGSRFAFRRRRRADGDGTAVPNWHGSTAYQEQQPEYFGTSQHDERDRTPDVGQGEEVLLRFLRNTLGPKAHNLAVRLMNKTPITSSAGFSYVIHQATEDSDLDIIRRDLTSGRLYQSGVKLVAGAWCNLLLGDRFTPGSTTRQRHELTYRRSTCSCILCRIRIAEMVRTRDQSRPPEQASETESTGLSADILSTMSSTSRTPTHSAMANFVVNCKLPSSEALLSIGASSSSRELEIGSVVRLNYRSSAKLKFTEDVRELFGHLAYTGPISHEEVYRRVTTIGVHYYLYNKGKKERKVYIQGELIRLPVQVGVVKLGTQPMYFEEVGATFCLHRKQIMSIYVGEIVLEGNSLGSFIKTGIRYYIGFGEERGVCPVFPNKTLGKARKLGINELLLHHHMVDDLEVRCL